MILFIFIDSAKDEEDAIDCEQETNGSESPFEYEVASSSDSDNGNSTSELSSGVDVRVNSIFFFVLHQCLIFYVIFISITGLYTFTSNR